MHPAPSIILFSVLSGAGFGMLTFLGLGLLTPTGWTAFAFFFIAYALAVGGLVSSTFHLGNPQRALKAFTQWRSSWLSREAWLAVGALLFMGIYALGAVFLGTHIAVLGWIGALLSMATVFATSMIYAQLKTVPRWNDPATPALFIAFSLTGGALLAAQMSIAAVLAVVTVALQAYVYATADRRFKDAGSTLATATGLGDRGSVRAFEPPHTGPNYLLKEMVHQVGRKHAQKLQILVLMALGVTLLAALFAAGHLLGALAILAYFAAALTQRWLFFAEAEHVVGLYYGKR